MQKKRCLRTPLFLRKYSVNEPLHHEPNFKSVHKVDTTIFNFQFSIMKLRDKPECKNKDVQNVNNML